MVKKEKPLDQEGFKERSRRLGSERRNIRLGNLRFKGGFLGDFEEEKTRIFRLGFGKRRFLLLFVEISWT